MSSELFVHQLNLICPTLGLSPQLTALLLSPIATELPKTLNAIIWVRQARTALAHGNISGAMMIQAKGPSARGILFTPRILDRPLLIAAAVTARWIGAMQPLLKSGQVTAGYLATFGLLCFVFAALAML